MYFRGLKYAPRSIMYLSSPNNLPTTSTDLKENIASKWCSFIYWYITDENNIIGIHANGWQVIKVFEVCLTKECHGSILTVVSDYFPVTSGLGWNCPLLLQIVRDD